VKSGILVIVLFVIGISGICSASPLDFSWSAPKIYVHNKGTGGEVRYVMWFYNLGNTIEKPIVVPVEVFLMTDTGEKYAEVFYPEIIEQSSKLDDDYKEGKKYQCTAIAKGELLPKTTKHCIAMFEDVDPKAKRLDIFVAGISQFFFWRGRMMDYSYKITYEKEADHWKLMEHGMSKDSSRRSYEFETRDW
jgi:hypothetical protein